MKVQGRTDLQAYVRSEFCRHFAAQLFVSFLWLSLQSCTSGGSTPPSLDAKRTPTSGPRPLQTVVPGRTPAQNPPQGTVPAGSGTPGTNPTLSASGTVAPGATTSPGLTRTPGGATIPPLSPTTANPPSNPTSTPAVPALPTRTVSVPSLPVATPTRTGGGPPAFPTGIPPGLPVPTGETARVRVKMSSSGQVNYTIEVESGLVASDVRYELAQVASSNAVAGNGSYSVVYSPGISITFRAGSKSCSAQVSAVTSAEVVVSGRSGGGVVCRP